MVGAMPAIYLDHNATTPLAPEAAEAMGRAERELWANPASQHAAGRAARRTLEDARESIGRILGADLEGSQPDRVVFTSGGTEANNLALLGLAGDFGLWTSDFGLQPSLHAVISAIEHPSVLAVAAELERRGWRVARVPATRDGVIEAEAFAARLAAGTRLAALMLANNETGVVQPVAEVAALCAARGVPLHADAAQAAGKMPIDFRRLGAATLAIAAHKFHGPRGIGALVVRHGVRLMPQSFGGVQQDGLRPGTACVVLAVVMQAALVAWHRDAERRAAHLAHVRDHFEAVLRAALPNITVHGERAARLPHTSNISFPGIDRQALFLALDQAGLACSTGSACASGSSEPSPTLRAMGLPPELVASALRFSFGAGNAPDEADRAAQLVVQTCRRLQPALCRGESPPGRVVT
jgi:cysteine desulfurase